MDDRGGLGRTVAPCPTGLGRALGPVSPSRMSWPAGNDP